MLEPRQQPTINNQRQAPNKADTALIMGTITALFGWFIWIFFIGFAAIAVGFLALVPTRSSHSLRHHYHE